MTTGDEQPRRRRRRAVGGTPPHDPPTGAGRRPRHRVADDPFGRSTDDTDVGWGGGPEDSDDERLRREVPPHW